MTDMVPGIALDDPLLERFQQMHDLDQDPESTNLAVVLVKTARDHGYPDDKKAASRALTGPPGAVVLQATTRKYLAAAGKYDEAAAERAGESLELVRQATSLVSQRQELATEAVTLSDGSSQTRAQVQVGHRERLVAAAQRESAGDYEHRAGAPDWPVRVAIVVVLSVLEAFLLIWPVTNASLGDWRSELYFGGLLALFMIMNEQLPKLAGWSVREGREARHAAHELTAIGITRGRDGDTEGRQILGLVDPARVRATARSAWMGCLWLGVVVLVYAMVMFTRILWLAAGLHRSLLFSVLAAALITTFTAGAPVLLAWWWSRGNALGDELQEYGMVTAKSRARQEELAWEVQARIRDAEATIYEAELSLQQGEQVLAQGQEVVAVALQKAASILGLPAVLGPDQANLRPVERPVRDGARQTLTQAADALEQVGTNLAGPAPFEPGETPPIPWAVRGEPRTALPIPEYVDAAQHGTLTAPTAAPERPPRLRWSRRGLLLAWVVLAVLAAAAVSVWLVGIG